MPGLIMERPKMSLQMHEKLKKYILAERRRKKEEDFAIERKIQEEKKKAEMTTLSLSQTIDQIKQLEIKMEDLTKQKTSLFTKLKKVLHEETILKKRPYETLLIQSSYHTTPAAVMPAVQPTQPPPSNLVYSHQPLRFFTPQTPNNRITMSYKSINDGSIKRQRSPSPNNKYQNSSSNKRLASPNQVQPPPPPQQQQQQQQPTFAPFSPNQNNKKPRPNTPQPSPASFSPLVIPAPAQQQQLRAPPAHYTASSSQSAFSVYPKNYILPSPQKQQQQQQMMSGLMSPVMHVPPSQVISNAFSQAHMPAAAAAPYVATYGLPSSRVPTNVMPTSAQLQSSEITNEQLKQLIPPAQWIKLLESNPSILPQQNGSIMSGYPLQRPPNNQ